MDGSVISCIIMLVALIAILFSLFISFLIVMMLLCTSFSIVADIFSHLLLCPICLASFICILTIIL